MTLKIGDKEVNKLAIGDNVFVKDWLGKTVTVKNYGWYGRLQDQTDQDYNFITDIYFIDSTYKDDTTFTIKAISIDTKDTNLGVIVGPSFEDGSIWFPLSKIIGGVANLTYLLHVSLTILESEAIAC